MVVPIVRISFRLERLRIGINCFYSVAYLEWLAHPTRFERVASTFGGWRSIQLSYGCINVQIVSEIEQGQSRIR